MSNVKRMCRVQGCTNPLKAGYLVCPSCWRQVPMASKKACRAAFKTDKAQGVIEANKIVKELGERLSPLVA